MSRSPWYFIPTLYFVSGLPYVIINTVSPILYKKLAVDNLQITFWTSLLYLPWVIKMFWSPIVDIYSTKRQWILTTNLLLFCALIGTAFSLRLPNFFAISLILLILSAFISATYDIANDGFYLLTLNPEQQAFFVGIRSLFYRLATIFASGFLVFFAGYLEKYIADNSLIWMIVLISSSLIMAGVFLWHLLILPKTPIDKPNENQTQNNNFIEIITLYFRQERIWAILAFILLYRLGEAMLVKIASLFLLDKSSVGGLGLSTSDVGLVYGTFGVLSLIVGGILGGIVISRYGLKKCLLPMALALNLPDIFYVYMAYHQPSLNFVYPLVALEQFGYGFGFTAFSVYLMYICRGQYKTSHFAISTGFMALGMMLPGILSGYIQKAVGYPLFFVIICFLTIPGMVTLFFIPLPEPDSIS